jgi:cytochrome c2
MKNLLLNTIIAFACIQLPIIANDKIPAGYKPITEFKEAIKESNGDKLIVLVIKGLDDDCPNCKEAMKNGERAVGSGVIKVFARAETLNKADLSSYPAALQERVQKKSFTTNAWVTFLVFDPKMEKIIAESSRTELQSNRQLTADFKKVVQEAKQKLK